MTSPNVQPETPTPQAPPTPQFVPVGELNTLPLYIGETGIVSKIVDSGVNHFYILAGHEVSVTENNKTKKTNFATIFRITNTIFGTACTPVEAGAVGLKEKADYTYRYTLPPIPYSMHTKMEKFFRTAHERHDTEAILCLLYDTNYYNTENPELGWGATAPVQENTPGDCKYSPETIVDSLPAHVILAGSAHSHPEMSAYASGTDHKDQAGWDGLHITYGWKTGVRNGAIELYHEIIYADVHWTGIALERVMELVPPIGDEPDPEVDDWLSNVSAKKIVTNNSWTGYQGGSVGPKSNSTPGSSGTSQPGSSGSRIPHFQGTNVLVPHRNLSYCEGAPDPSRNILVGLISPEDYQDPTCPHCGSPVEQLEYSELHRCYGCMQFIGIEGVDISAYNEDRMKVNARPYDELDPAKASLPIIMMKITYAQGTKVFDFSDDQRTEECQKKAGAQAVS